MSITVGVCGTGAFARHFIPLFKAHPRVRRVVLCDLNAAKLKETSEKFGLPDTCPSLDELCRTDVDAIAIFTQNDRHGPQAVQALKSGKHVYSAVPSAISMEEITDLVRTVEATDRIYMIGETSVYYPCALYCRKRFQEGAFGRVVYAEAEYMHDFDHGLYDVSKWRFGDDWQRRAGSPPFFYPTHSVSMVVSVTGAHVTHVCGMGVEDRHADGLFTDDNVWHNRFSNETMLARMSDGSVARFNEFRRIGHPGEVRMSLYGTEGSYEEQFDSRIWVGKGRDSCQSLADLLTCDTRPVQAPDREAAAVGGEWLVNGVSKVHPIELLPREYSGLGNGHNGSHQFLIHEFVTACVAGRHPANNVWQAARYLVPGLVAHDSAMQGGQLLAVPDFGNGPL